jgi:uncharacterized repeat protein (TIGR03803 family)
MTRSLFRTSKVSILLCLALTLAFASREGNAQSLPTGVTSPTNGHHFGVDFTFKGVDGSSPTAALVQDAVGNLYGTTSAGGYGVGVVFKLDIARRETVLYAFSGSDGATPYGALVLDSSSNVYGTTSAGGDFGLGTVFKIDPQGVETVLYSFAGSPDGASPYAGLVMDNTGNLYGTTENGGAFGFGIVFKIDTSGIETVLHSFAGNPTDGADPKSRLIVDQNGNLYGTTFAGGSGNSGTVFKIDTTGAATILYNFTGGSDGENPFGGVTLDANGLLYGTTQNSTDSTVKPYGCCKGTVYVLNGTNQTTLYTFTGGSDGGGPSSDLVLYNGMLYGTTLTGGPSQKGTVFSLNLATGVESVLHGFTGQGDGGTPAGGLLINPAGVLYGTAEGGGRFMKGTVYQENQ